jgi:hypothetical protein
LNIGPARIDLSAADAVRGAGLAWECGLSLRRGLRQCSAVDRGTGAPIATYFKLELELERGMRR